MSLMDIAKEEGITELQLNAVMGSILGDAYLQGTTYGRKSIRWNHSIKQEEYVNHKYAVLQELATRPPFRRENPGYGDFWSLLTLKTTETFGWLFSLTRPGDVGIKRVTKEYLDNITHPIALAWWFMDDGSRSTNSNTAVIHTNGFLLEDVELLAQWLKGKWGVNAAVMTVTHSSTGKKANVLYLHSDAFVKLANLIRPYVPQCMEYKSKIFTTKCSVCGAEFPLSRKKVCSPACAYVRNLEVKRKYAEAHKEKERLRKRAWKQAHRDEINTAARERYAAMTQSQKDVLNLHARLWRERNPEKAREIKRKYLEAHRDDPVFQERKKLSDARYYQSVKADPEKHAKRLECSRKRRKREDVRAQEREYLRNRRMEKRAENPEELARYLDHKDHLEKLSNMTQEEKAAYAKERDTKARHKREAAMSPEEKAALTAKKVQQNKERLEKMRQDPVRWAKFLADEKRRREARKAKRLARQQGSSTTELSV